MQGMGAMIGIMIILGLALAPVSAPVFARERPSAIGHEIGAHGALVPPGGGKASPLSEGEQGASKTEDAPKTQDGAAACLAAPGAADSGAAADAARQARADADAGPVETLPERARAALTRLVEARPDETEAVRAHYLFNLCMALGDRGLGGETLAQTLAKAAQPREEPAPAPAETPREASEASKEGSPEAPRETEAPKEDDASRVVADALREAPLGEGPGQITPPDEQKAVELALKPFGEGSAPTDAQAGGDAAAPSPGIAVQAEQLHAEQGGAPVSPPSGEKAPEPGPSAPPPEPRGEAGESAGGPPQPPATPPEPAAPKVEASPEVPASAAGAAGGEGTTGRRAFYVVTFAVAGLAAASLVAILVRRREPRGRPSQDEGDVVVGDLRETTGAPVRRRPRTDDAGE